MTVLIFGIASAGCVLAQNIGIFLVFRMLQGGMIAGYALSLAIVRDTRSERQAISLIGYFGILMAVAPMLGPMLGGVLDTYFGWPSIFLFYAVTGVGLLLLCWLDLGGTRPKATEPFTTSVIGATALVWEPLFWVYALCGKFSVGAFIVFLTGAHLVAQATFDGGAGFYIGTITVGFMRGGFVAGRIGARFDPTTTMIAGRIIACTGLAVSLALLAVGPHHPLSSAAAQFLST